MKRSLYVGMAALAVVAFVGTLVYADGETNTVACPCPCYGGSAVMKDATMVVQNTAASVTITVTAANAEQVKAIQAAFANSRLHGCGQVGKGTNAPCAMMNRVACQKMRRAAGCCACPAATGTTEDPH